SVPRLLVLDAAPPELYTLSLHDALPISWNQGLQPRLNITTGIQPPQPRSQERVHASEAGDEKKPIYEQTVLERIADGLNRTLERSEEHTSELQSRENLVCRLLLEKKNAT